MHACAYVRVQRCRRGKFACLGGEYAAACFGISVSCKRNVVQPAAGTRISTEQSRPQHVKVSDTVEDKRAVAIAFGTDTRQMGTRVNK